MSFRPWIAAGLLLAVAMPAVAGAETQLAGRAAYEFPAWGDAVEATDVEKYTTEAEYAAAAGDDRYRLERLRYRSDGLVVVAYLYGPRSAPPAPRPVVVFNRGSYVRGDIAPELLPMFSRLAEAGFTVVAPLYRGSDGAEGRDEMGGADLADLMSVAGLLGELGGLDPENVFLYGESRGGMMVFQAIRDGFPARAAATWGALSDLEPIVSSEQGLGMAKAIWSDFEARRDEIVERRSAVRWPEALDLPLLLLHGSDDGAMPVSQTLRLASALAEGDGEFGVVVFPGGGHLLTENRFDRDRLVTDFFRRHLVE